MSRDYKKQQDEKDRQGQGAGRPGADRDDDKERADTGTQGNDPQQPPPADPGGGVIEGGRGGGR